MAVLLLNSLTSSLTVNTLPGRIMRATLLRHSRLLRASAGTRFTDPSILLRISTHPKRRPFSTGDEDDPQGDFNAWKPPDKPLVGDIGKSHDYSHVEDAEVLRELEVEMEQLETQEGVFLEDLQDQDKGDSDDADDTWVRPDRELGSIREKVYGEDVEVVEDGGEAEKVQQAMNESDRYQAYLDKLNNPELRVEPVVAPDWLSTRREMLKEGPKMLKPDQAKVGIQTITDLPIKRHSLLSKDEILSVVGTMGGMDIQVFMEDTEKPFMCGAEGRILVTSDTHQQRVAIAKTLKRQLRKRDLQDVGVVGAHLGIEGNLSDSKETWLVLDCQNYVVHIIDSRTRANLNLEKLWSGRDALWSLDISDEEACDEYVSQNPVPKEHEEGALDRTYEEALRILRRARSVVPNPEAGVRKPKRRRRRRRRHNNESDEYFGTPELEAGY